MEGIVKSLAEMFNLTEKDITDVLDAHVDYLKMQIENEKELVHVPTLFRLKFSEKRKKAIVNTKLNRETNKLKKERQKELIKQIEINNNLKFLNRNV